MTSHSSPVDAVNADSFVDICASVVSIMLIMVMLIGMRIKKMPVDAPPSASAVQLQENLHKLLAQEQSLRGDVLKLAAEISNIEQLAAIHKTHRDMLGFSVAALEERLRQRQEGAGQRTQDDIRLAQAIDAARHQIEQLRQQRAALETVAAAPIVIESYPTPISRTVDEDEVHFQLRNGRIAAIPWQQLIERMIVDVRRNAEQLRQRGELRGTVGPVDGFRLEYTVLWREVPAEEAIVTRRRSGSYPELELFTIHPTSTQLGEPVEEALRSQSEFRRRLAELRPGKHTITVWVYPDSFGAFRILRKELYGIGFGVAGRPLPAGMPIGGSPHGSKTAAQ